MIIYLKRTNWLWVKVIVLATVAIPLGITAYELIILGKESVMFLGGYPAAWGITVMLYYALLLVAGIIWLIVQLKALVSLKNEKMKNELLHLQSQVNPHFFFNMLNNLYGLVGKDTDRAQALILKLSDLMRYSIYEGEKPFVTLKEEVGYLQNYIALHKMRYHKTIDIQFNTDIADEKAQIRPLLFIILLENAFKHGVEKLRNDAFVHINIKAYAEAVTFEIENNFETSEFSEKPGIGLKNLKRRLELAYPKKYKLVLTNDNSVFRAHLQLQNG